MFTISLGTKSAISQMTGFSASWVIGQIVKNNVVLTKPYQLIPLALGSYGMGIAVGENVRGAMFRNLEEVEQTIQQIQRHRNDTQ